ncbi:hypothetical protein [Rubritalea profundi]|uniref:Uncharacterized protein n=1 Tax=Rubritalea profundi TaxID=1658618 RepID=A0A2S7TYJ0_9BACT|nr:hypothetical protein [Rubritalea profundi]PQJ27825.1 hypothetical protein BSZ32_04470 [Rubritalea profundi]
MNKPVRKLFSVVQEEPKADPNQKEMVNRKAEAQRVVKRLEKIIKEHYQASLSLSIDLSDENLKIVTNALRDHARGGTGNITLKENDEIRAHCLNRLFEELVEEPSNILYTTSTGADTMRYDAMDLTFWIECLDLLDQSIAAQ